MRAKLLAVAIAFLASSGVDAQATGGRQGVGGPGRAGPLQRGRTAGQQPVAAADRAGLERQFRQALARVARRQLGLTPVKMSQLAAVDQKFERQRRALAQRARQTRLALRTAMADSAPPQPLIAQQLDTLLQLERQRIDLLESEQKELATFLTPLQRAKYQALQEQLRRRLEALRVGAGQDSALGIRPDSSPR